MAARATLHCLTGCAIGEILGMVIGTALGWGNTETMVLAIVLAFFFGYTLTLRSILKAGCRLPYGVPGRPGRRHPLHRGDGTDRQRRDRPVAGRHGRTARRRAVLGALALSLAVAFVVTTPVNKWMIGRGKGHAVVHRYHH